jgi:hypothetical protein
MATLADLQTKTDAAIAALEAGEFAVAIRACNAALLIIATIPDTQFDGGDQIRFDRQGATLAIQSIKRSANAGAWSQSSAVEQIQYEKG